MLNPQQYLQSGHQPGPACCRLPEQQNPTLIRPGGMVWDTGLLSRSLQISAVLSGGQSSCSNSGEHTEEGPQASHGTIGLLGSLGSGARLGSVGMGTARVVSASVLLAGCITRIDGWTVKITFPVWSFQRQKDRAAHTYPLVQTTYQIALSRAQPA